MRRRNPDERIRGAARAAADDPESWRRYGRELLRAGNMRAALNAFGQAKWLLGGQEHSQTFWGDYAKRGRLVSQDVGVWYYTPPKPDEDPLDCGITPRQADPNWWSGSPFTVAQLAIDRYVFLGHLLTKRGRPAIFTNWSRGAEMVLTQAANSLIPLFVKRWRSWRNPRTRQLEWLGPSCSLSFRPEFFDHELREDAEEELRALEHQFVADFLLVLDLHVMLGWPLTRVMGAAT